MSKIYQKMYPEKKSRSEGVLNGFTLIELLVVILIIGVLAAIALPKYQTAVDEARYAQVMLNTNAAYKAQQLYLMAHGNYATSFNQLDKDMLPAGYTVSESSKQLYSKNFVITLGFGSNSQSTYLYSTDNRAHTGYYVRYDTGAKSCWAYPAGGERAQRLCSSMTGKTNPRTDSVTQALIYDF